MALCAGVLSIAGTTPVSAAPPAKSNKDGLALPISSFTLDNGLRVFVVEDHSTPAFSIVLTYDVGSIDEVPGRTGFAHFFEHMMFMGSKNIGRFKIGEYTERAGGNFNASTSYDVTTYFHNIPSNYLDMILWAEADRLGGLEISEESFETQRAAVKSEKDRGENIPYSKIFQEQFLPDLFPGTKYVTPVIGSLDDLNAARIEDVREFFGKYYSPSNCVMVLVGDVDLADVKSKVEKHFGPIPAGQAKAPTNVGQSPAPTRIEKSIADDKAQQTLLAFGWRTVAEDHPDRPALDLLGQIVFGSDSARLPKKLNDELKLTVGAGGGHQNFRYVGAMFMTAVPTSKAKKEEISKVIEDELANVRSKGVTAKELEKARNGQIMGTLSTLATNQGRAFSIATNALFYGKPSQVVDDLERYRKVTPADIKRVANTYLNENWVYYEMKPGK